ncbi:MAG: AI-2E family transporter [Minisyncoccales bacterium]
MKKADVTMIDLTWRSLFKVAVALVLFYIVYLLHSVLVWILLSLIISTLLNPLIEILEKRKVHRIGAAIIVYFSILLSVVLTVYIVIPPMITELQTFSSGFSKYFENIPGFLSSLGLSSFENIASLSSGLNESLVKVSSNIFNVFIFLFDSIFAGITVFVLSLFMSIEEKEIIKGLRLVSPKEFEEEVIKRWSRSKDQVVMWFGSRVVSCICVALMTFLLCVVLKIKFALSLALMAGVLNIIPMIGPIISGAILCLFALDSLPKLALAVVSMIIIQQIESNVLTPIFTKKMVGLPNVLVLLSIIIGGILGGIIGAILAIPLTGIIFEGLKDYFNSRKLS